MTVAVAGTSELVDVTITWAGGHQTTGQAVRPVARLDQLSYYPALLTRVTALTEAGCTTRQIADTLNTEGFRPPKRTTRFRPDQVRILLNQHNLRTSPQRGQPAVLAGLAPGEWLGHRPGRHPGHAHRHRLQLDLPRTGSPPRHIPGSKNWIITADAAEMQQLRERRARPAGFFPPAPAGPSPPTDKERSNEKTTRLDGHQRWPISTGQRSPAARISRVSVSGWPSGTKQ